MILIRKLLWLDCCAALIAGVAVLSLSDWLSQLHTLPKALLVGIGLVNLIFGAFSLTLAMRPIRPFSLIVLLVTANAVWAGICILIAAVFKESASVFGMVHLVGEGVFVGGLAVLEWNQREQLCIAVPLTSKLILARIKKTSN